MTRKILKWTGSLLLILIAGVSIITATRQHVKYSAPYPAIKASNDSSMIARGKQIIYGPAHCVECHNAGNVDSLLLAGANIPLSGGRKFSFGLGNFYTKNITPDVATGIGKYTDGEIARVLRYGVHADGTAVFDFMPFHNMTDEDLTAVISYLRAQQPVYNKVPMHEPNLLGKMVIAFMVKPVGPSEPIKASIPQDTSAAYGKYLVTNVANCSGCHTKRSLSGAYKGELMAGGSPIAKEGFPALTPPNVTGDSSSRIFRWSQSDFVNRFHEGKKIPFSEMPWNSFKSMSDNDLKAVYNYLKSIKSAKSSEDASLVKK